MIQAHIAGDIGSSELFGNIITTVQSGSKIFETFCVQTLRRGLYKFKVDTASALKTTVSELLRRVGKYLLRRFGGTLFLHIQGH